MYDKLDAADKTLADLKVDKFKKAGHEVDKNVAAMLVKAGDGADELYLGVMNAAPFTARLLTSAPLPEWHKATPEVREVAKKAVDFCKEQGTDIAKLALQFSLAHPGFATCISGSANPKRIREWAEWAAEPMDQALVGEVQKILEPIHNWHHIEGLPENNDTPTNPLPTNIG